jgi:hypothetical protein
MPGSPATRTIISTWIGCIRRPDRGGGPKPANAASGTTRRAPHLIGAPKDEALPLISTDAQGFFSDFTLKPGAIYRRSIRAPRSLTLRLDYRL